MATTMGKSTKSWHKNMRTQSEEVSHNHWSNLRCLRQTSMFAANRFTQKFSMSLSFSQLNLLQLSYVTLPGLWLLLDFTGLNSLLLTTPVHQYINLKCIVILCGCLDEGLTSFVWVLARWCRQLGNTTYNFFEQYYKIFKIKTFLLLGINDNIPNRKLEQNYKTKQVLYFLVKIFKLYCVWEKCCLLPSPQ